MKKICFSVIAALLLIITSSCRKEKLDPNIPVNWKHSVAAPAGCSIPASGSSAYYVVFSQGKYSFPMMHSVWMQGSIPVTNNRGQMLFGASTTLPIGTDPWNTIVNFFAKNKTAEYVVISHFIDGGPHYETWTITNL